MRIQSNRRQYLLLLVSLSLISACESNANLSDTNISRSESADKPRVALIMKSLANEFFSQMQKGAQEHQAAHSDEYELIANGIKDERDVNRQVTMVDEMVATGVDAIVIAPADSLALIPALRRAQSKGIVIVNIDNQLDKSTLAAEKISIPFVGPDNRAGAKKVGEYLAQQLADQEGPKVVLLEGITTSFNAQQRKLGFEDAMREAGIEIIDSQSADWEMSKANSVTAAMLNQHEQLHGILAANDSMALGAVSAVKAAGRSSEIKIAGFDNISAIQDAIQADQVVATADQHADQLAVYGIETALKLLADSSGEVNDIETPVDLITK